ncbi:hypothetical protein [Arthrobacter woluwensis]|uniref:DUF2335 domain-containing protein n=1 Tax=Arthrobacter woluwensis TaxID=156980 RepID=A0A1H4I813_9MICC|nr:hypothetical protein [Arthrobacter woluwensis]SEB30197.1 hypothetical protein SAMN04489745_0119 [Arthrobacter woluwensis]
MAHSPAAPLWITDLHGIPQPIPEERISQALTSLESIDPETLRRETQRGLGRAATMIALFLLFLLGARLTNDAAAVVPVGLAVMAAAIAAGGYFIWKWLLHEEGTPLHA